MSVEPPKPSLLHGILLVDKPSGYTSQQTVSHVKKLLHVKKAGHTGSLDPIATGLLPVCIGEATKFSQFLLGAQKHYRVVAKLGVRTNTGDTEGTVIEERPIPKLSTEKIERVLETFKGNILQIPPMFSALKHQGKPLYHWARQGIDLNRPSRPVTIHTLELISYQEDTLVLEVACSKGTYIRSLVEDIAKALSSCGHVTVLKRLSVAKYKVEQSVSIQALAALPSLEARQKLMLSINDILPEQWLTFAVSASAAFYLRRGQPLLLPSAPTQGSIKLTLKETGSLLGVGRILNDGRIAPHRLIQE